MSVLIVIWQFWTMMTLQWWTWWLARTVTSVVHDRWQGLLPKNRQWRNTPWKVGQHCTHAQYHVLSSSSQISLFSSCASPGIRLDRSESDFGSHCTKNKQLLFLGVIFRSGRPKQSKSDKATTTKGVGGERAYSLHKEPVGCISPPRSQTWLLAHSAKQRVDGLSKIWSW